jgi:4-hydroxybenzoate polyprenyltransferase
MPVYQINKGINKPIEFKGLKAQYIGYLAGGLVGLLILFAVMYISGLPVYGCILVISISGGGLFYQVFRLSHKYGQYGLMKRSAMRYLPRYLKFNSRKLFTRLKK